MLATKSSFNTVLIQQKVGNNTQITYTEWLISFIANERICKSVCFVVRYLITCAPAAMLLLRAGIVFSGVCESVRLAAENLENYWSEIDVTW